MSRPSDASIAKAFFEAYKVSAYREPQHQPLFSSIIDRAIEFDAEASAPAPFERCPKCTAHLPPGKHCAGASCPMRK